MKLLDADWATFFGGLDHWRRVPPAARRMFLEFVQPSLPFTAEAAAEAIPFLIESGLLVGTHGKGSARVAEELRPFARLMRAMYRYRVFDPGHHLPLGQYLADHFSFEERAAFGAGDLHAAAAAVGSRSWIEGFLQSPDTAEWERSHQDSRARPFFATPATGEPARRLVSLLLRRARPAELRELQLLECFAGDDPERIGLVLGGCFRYCLLYPGLRPADLEPVAGVWPGIVARRRRRAAPPAAAEAAQSFHAPLLIHDMSAVLVECAASPLPVRRTDLALFSRSVAELAGLLYPLPPWCEAVVPKTPETRLRAAQLFLHAAGFVALLPRRGQELRMGATEGGKQWLALPTKERLRRVFMLLDRDTSSLPGDRRLEYLPLPPAPLLLSGKLDLRGAVSSLFRGLESGRSVEYRAFLKQHCQRSNPYLELRLGGVRMSVRGPEGYREPTTAELEEQWERLIERFFAQRLLVLDAVALGLTEDRRLCFSLTDAGRCFLGLAVDFTYDTEEAPRIIVQPNFEVVFLSASAQAEASIGRYAERVGREVGTIFRITKRSVIRAAAAGLGVEAVLGSLREHAGGSVPGNVAAEIEGWLGQCRSVRIESALLIRCLDGETAARAVSAAGKLVRLISETVLEVAEPRQRALLERKLSEEGIFLDAAPDRRPGAGSRGTQSRKGRGST